MCAAPFASHSVLTILLNVMLRACSTGGGW